MTALTAIVLFGLLMSLLALSGGLALLLPEAWLKRLMLPLVAFASGSLIGGAFFHILPAALMRLPSAETAFLWLALGFLAFLILEQGLSWRHCHLTPAEHRDSKRTLGVMILIADGLHNLLGGLSIGTLFIADFRLGLSAWLAAALHELPQELGDFGILLHGGWSKAKALTYNFLSALTFLVGGLLAYGLSEQANIDWLIPFAAGNFLYIGAVDLAPEFKDCCDRRANWPQLLAFSLGLASLYFLA